MANLLSLEIRKGVHKEYLIRLISVALLLVSFCVVAGVLLLIPAYLNARSELLTVKYEIEETRNSGLAVVDIESQARATAINARAKFIAGQNNSAIEQYIHYTAAMNQLPTSLVYSRVNFEAQPTDDGFDQLSVSGFAPTRSVLASAIDQIQDLEWVNQVEYPFSSLGQSRDIDFTLTVSYQKSNLPEVIELYSVLDKNSESKTIDQPEGEIREDPLSAAEESVGSDSESATNKTTP